jgi:uncharacterized membrane protein (UPF0127 family)
MLIWLLVAVAVAGFWLSGMGYPESVVPTGVPSVVAVDKITTPVDQVLSTSTVSVGSHVPVAPGQISDTVDWGEVVPITIGAVAVRASVADSLAERMAGLSNTPSLPLNMVKLFVFDTDGPHGIWMKDMQYPIDIIWLDSEGRVVHIAPSVDPSTYPASFFSPVPARYVVEAGAGFAATHGVVPGTQAQLPLLW